ncbi:MAG: helix-turn-helix domain-containing protein [Bosea sp.]|nr:helix-turn-helix domain-containing protein [Bosea sp. (in: a-proteobacteria)]
MTATAPYHLEGRPYSTRELAERWGVSDQHIRDVIATGALRSFRVGHLIRIPAAAVEEFECQISRPSSTEGGGTPSGAKTEQLAEQRSALRIVRTPSVDSSISAALEPLPPAR